MFLNIEMLLTKCWACEASWTWAICSWWFTALVASQQKNKRETFPIYLEMDLNSSEITVEMLGLVFFFPGVCDDVRTMMSC